MFKAEMSDVDLLKNSIPIIAEILDEGTFRVDKKGISLVSPDRTMVSVVDFRLLSTAFDEFSAEGDVSLGLNLANLVAVLRRVKAGDKVTLESDGKDKLKITVRGNGVRTFELPLIDIKAEKPPIEQLAFSGKVDIESSVMEDGISDADIVGDSVVFEAEAKNFRISAKGDISSTELSLGHGDKGLIRVESKGKIRARYPLDYLKKMVKATKLSNQVAIEFGTDYPMKLEFRSLDKLKMDFILAPRVEE